ncbi:MAG: hypothetical protein GY697_08735, partial [Desulfobacterales bacterium]|nr:hypothetical protein [Desulfobacterales bacterium]
PRHKACAGGLTVKTLRALRYPVDAVIRNRCRSMEIGKRFARPVQFSGPREICAMTVRSELDTYCLEKALAAGSRFSTTGRIHAIRENRNFVDIQTSTGLLKAAYLIGADGAQSRVRKLSNEFANSYQGFAIEGTFPINPEDPPRMAFDFNVIGSGYGWLFPKDDHVNIGLFTGSPTVTLRKKALLAYARRKLGRTDIHNLSGHPMGMGGWRYRPRCRRILLAGDAAGLVDPLLGEGLYNAVRSGQLAARAIVMSESINKTAGYIYDSLLEDIRFDLRLCRLSAAWFYRMPDFGHWALTSRPVRSALMKGFALGWPLGRIGTDFYRLPFLTY